MVPRELNVDESQALATAMRFTVHPQAWKAIDSANFGTLDILLPAGLLLVGFKPTFVFVHLLATVLVWLQVLVAYLTLRRLGSEKAAALGGFLMVFVYGLYTHPEYLHYSTELLPNLLLMLGFYLFIVWMSRSSTPHPRASLVPLLLSGLTLGAAPWAKLQALPIATALGLVVFVAIFRLRRPVSSRSRGAELCAFNFGAVTTTCTLLPIWVHYYSLGEFWYSYVRGPLAYAGGFTLTHSLRNLVTIFTQTPVNQLLVIGYLGLVLLGYAQTRGAKIVVFDRQSWALKALMVYVVAGLFAASRARFFWPKHAMFCVAPLVYVSAILAVAGISEFMQVWRKEGRLGPAALFPLVVLAFLVVVYVGYLLRYVEMVNDIRSWSRTQETSLVRAKSQRAPSSSEAHNGGAESPLSGLIGPGKLYLKDSNEQITEGVHRIERTYPVRSLAIWGWAPGVYVLTGIPPAVRDAQTYFQQQPGPFRSAYRARFLDDLRSKRPDLFIDAVVPDAFPRWVHWSDSDGYESDPELRHYIDANYVVADQVTLAEGSKPVRFLVRRETGR